MFLFVGVMEEMMKMSAVHAVDDNRIRHIDDAVMFAILAALGFAFTENILYFYLIWAKQGPENLLFRSYFALFFQPLRIFLFSGFGYYYGVAHFAKPLLRKIRTATTLFGIGITGFLNGKPRNCFMNSIC